MGANRNERSFRLRGTPLSRRGLLRLSGAAALTQVLPPVRNGAASRLNPVDRIVARMSLTEKIAQMFVIQAAGTVMPGWYWDILTTFQPGGVIFVAPNIGSPDQIRAYISAIQSTGTHVPPFVAVDQEGGPVSRVPGDAVPGANVIGTLSDLEALRLAKQRAEFLKSYGFNVNFAPVADVAFSPYSTMAWRSFGSDPQAVASKIQSMVVGSRNGGVGSAAKHFPGHGRTQVDSHVALPVIDVSLDEWLATDGIPFQRAVESGVEMIMLGHLRFTQWDDAPTSLSFEAVQVLRNQLGYTGVTITDDLGMGALAGTSPYDLVDRAVDAGLDMMIYTAAPEPFSNLAHHIAERVRLGEISESRIDLSVRRILTLKGTWFRP